MTRMTGDHRSAARLRHIADEKSRPAIKIARVGSKVLKKIEQSRMAPVAGARQPHHLPIRAIDWKGYRPGKAASCVCTNRASSKRSGTRGGTKKLICRWLFSWWSFDRCFFSRWFLGRALDILLFRSSTTGSDSRGPFMCGLSRYRSAYQQQQ